MNRHRADISPSRTLATMSKKSASSFGDRTFTFVFLKSIIMAATAGKVLASMFCDAQSILFIDYLEKGRHINSKCYIALFVYLKEEIGHK